MRRSPLARLAPFVPFALLALACTAPAPDDSLYLDIIAADRAEKDRAFLEAPDSPVRLEDRDRFLPLSYYPPNLDYRVPAGLQVAEEQLVFDVPTSAGTIRSMQRVGVLEFTLQGQSRTLSALIEVENPTLDLLFVPFADETNGSETYNAGRYLELDLTTTGLYDLDFNRAFHPHCYYDADAYVCPYPPPENRLPTASRAGERLSDPQPPTPNP